MPNDIESFYVHEVYPASNCPTMKELIYDLKKSEELSTYPVDSVVPGEQSMYKNGASLMHFLIAIVRGKNISQPDDKEGVPVALSGDLTYMEDYQVLYVLKVEERYNKDNPKSLNLKEIVEKREAGLEIAPMYHKLFEALRRPKSGSTQVEQVVAQIKELYKISKTTGESAKSFFGIKNHKKDLIVELDKLLLKKDASVSHVKEILVAALYAKFKSTENQLLTQAILSIMDLSERRPTAEQRKKLVADDKGAPKPPAQRPK